MLKFDMTKINTSFVSLNINYAHAENLFSQFYQLHFSHD